MKEFTVLTPIVTALDNIFPLDQKVSIFRVFLPRLIATFTHKPRYFPKIKWASNDFTYDMFRAFELIFGKEYGVKLRSTGEIYTDPTSPIGYRIRNKKFYTVEARIADLEGALRYDIKAIYEKFKEYKIVRNPTLAYSLATFVAIVSKISLGTLPLVASVVTIGLANDGSTTTFTAGGTGASLNFGCGDASGTSATPTYGGVNMTAMTTTLSRCWGAAGSGIYNFQLTNPPSGSNTLAIPSGSAGAYHTWTGIDSTNSTSAFNVANETACGTGATSIDITTTRDACMMGGFTNGGALPSIATNSVLDTIDYTSGGHNYVLHSSATFNIQTVTCTVSNSASGIAVLYAVQPPSSAVSLLPFKSLLGVGK